MIARPEWFSRRKYGGWGVSPKTWHGWVYIAIITLIPLVSVVLTSDSQILFICIGIWAILLVIDLIPVMVGIKKDEREVQIEAIAERNTAWFMSIVLVLGIVYDIIQGALEERVTLPSGLEGINMIMSHVNGFMLLALIGGIIVKSLSNFILDHE